jgi:hypothetical protein
MFRSSKEEMDRPKAAKKINNELISGNFEKDRSGREEELAAI